MDIGQHYTISTETNFKFRFISYFNGSETIITTQKLATLGFLYLNQCLAAGGWVNIRLHSWEIMPNRNAVWVIGSRWHHFEIIVRSKALI